MYKSSNKEKCHTKWLASFTFLRLGSPKSSINQYNRLHFTPVSKLQAVYLKYVISSIIQVYHIPFMLLVVSFASSAIKLSSEKVLDFYTKDNRHKIRSARIVHHILVSHKLIS